MVQRFDYLKDIAMTDDGDWDVDNGDFAMASGADVLRDDIHIRAMTDAPTLRSHQWLGASMEDFTGRRNDQETAELAESRLLGALARDGNLLFEDIEIITAPVGRSLVMAISIEGLETPFMLEVSLDSGLKKVRW